MATAILGATAFDALTRFLSRFSLTLDEGEEIPRKLFAWGHVVSERKRIPFFHLRLPFISQWELDYRYWNRFSWHSPVVVRFDGKWSVRWFPS